MDDTIHFMELSALLTGLYDQLLNDPDKRARSIPLAEEYARRLLGTFPLKFPALLDAYKHLAEDPKPPVNDVLLAKLRATQAFKDNEVVAKQIVNVWYLSQFEDETRELRDGGFYERGTVWPTILAHPIGFSNQMHGYWTSKPGAP
jgi:hypothetical protein